MTFVNTKTIIPIIIILILLFIIRNIINSIMTLSENSHIVTTLKLQEQKDKNQQQFLKQQLYFVNTPSYIENQAREKLGMVKQGEHIVLAPLPIQNSTIIKKTNKTPNWQKWWKLFF